MKGIHDNDYDKLYLYTLDLDKNINWVLNRKNRITHCTLIDYQCILYDV